VRVPACVRAAGGRGVRVCAWGPVFVLPGGALTTDSPSVCFFLVLVPATPAAARSSSRGAVPRPPQSAAAHPADVPASCGQTRPPSPIGAISKFEANPILEPEKALKAGQELEDLKAG